MKHMTVFVFAIAAAFGCGKKDESGKPAETTKAEPSPSPSTPTTATPTTPTTATPTEAAKPTEGSAPAGEPVALKSVPADIAQSCKDAEVTMKKLVACNTVDAKTKADMSKSWNSGVDGSYSQWSKASADQKKTIEGSCESLNKSLTMLTADCK